MMTDTVSFALLGFLGAGGLEGLLMAYLMMSWITHDCAEQGPDYIKAKFLRKLASIWGWSLLCVVLFGLLDYFRHATVLDFIRIIPSYAERGDPLIWSVALWIGAFAGLVIGALAGCFGAMASCSKSKCLFAQGSK
jgi:hypothetical protein